MGSAYYISKDQARRALDSAQDVQKSISSTREAIARSHVLLTDNADPWPAPPELIRYKFWAHLDTTASFEQAAQGDQTRHRG